jgi:hypothetical protein
MILRCWFRNRSRFVRSADRRRAKAGCWQPPRLYGVSDRADRAIERRAQIGFAKRLKQTLNGASSEKCGTKVEIAAGRNENNRYFHVTTAQFLLQLRPRHARQRDIQYQTSSVRKHVGGEKILCGTKCDSLESEHIHKIGEGLS